VQSQLRLHDQIDEVFDRIALAIKKRQKELHEQTIFLYKHKKQLLEVQANSMDHLLEELEQHFAPMQHLLKEDSVDELDIVKFKRQSEALINLSSLDTLALEPCISTSGGMQIDATPVINSIAKLGCFVDASLPPQMEAPQCLFDKKEEALKITWKPVPMDSNFGEKNTSTSITYHLEMANQKDMKFVSVFEGETLEEFVYECEPANMYLFRVFAVNEHGEGPKSPLSLPVRVGDIPTKPNRPIVEIMNDSQVLVKWEEADSNGCAIENYTLVAVDPNDEKQLQEVYTGLDLQVDVTPLFEQTKYRFKVKAKNIIGESPFSDLSLVSQAMFVYAMGLNSSTCVLCNKLLLELKTVFVVLFITKPFFKTKHTFIAGQLGTGETNATAKNSKPIQLTALNGLNIVQVCCGEGHVLALSADGAVFSWGNNRVCTITL